jgi:transcriptional regulator with XRE-family HTH domain
LLKENYQIYSVISDNIKKYRKKRGMTQQELSLKTGYSYSYIRKIEGPNCPKNFSVLTLYNIAKTLDISIMCLFEDNDI